MIAHINIGSNLGNRAEIINRAVSLLGRVGYVQEISRPIESEPWGYESPNRFMNLGVNVETALDASEIVKKLKEIEGDIDPCGTHRTPLGGYSDRTIDLDLIALGETVDNNPEATIPHPRMHLREFVARPMAEIRPGWIHPRLGLSIEKILLELSNKPRR